MNRMHCQTLNACTCIHESGASHPLCRDIHSRSVSCEWCLGHVLTFCITVRESLTWACMCAVRGLG